MKSGFHRHFLPSPNNDRTEAEQKANKIRTKRGRFFPLAAKIAAAAKEKTYVYDREVKRKLASGVRRFKSGPLSGLDGS